MKKFLNTSDRQALRQLQRNVRNRTEYIKVTVLLMLDQGHSVNVICESLGIDGSTIYKYKQAFEEDGLDKYLDTNYSGKWGLLSCVQLSALRKELNQRLYTDSKEVIKYIESEFGVTYTVSGVIDLLHRMGYNYKKTDAVPCEADGEKQVEFLEQELPKMLEAAANEKAVVYYVDGVHPTHNTRSSYGWIEVGEKWEQRTVSGRDRVNINGAVNALDVTDVVVVETDRINAQSTQSLYEKIAAKHPNREIYLIQDNAKYYRNKGLKEWLNGQNRIKQVFLPPYSPNLNLIERLWKFMKKKVINTGFYRTKNEFRDAIMAFFQNIEQHRDALVTLLSLNFHALNSTTKTY